MMTKMGQGVSRATATHYLERDRVVTVSGCIGRNWECVSAGLVEALRAEHSGSEKT